MQDRQADIQDATSAGNGHEVGQVVQHPHRPWCPTQSSDEASFGVALGLERLHTQALCTGFAESVIGQEARQLVSQVSGGFVMTINHGILVVRACPRPHFWTVRRESDSDDGREWSVVLHGRLTEERRHLTQSG